MMWLPILNPSLAGLLDNFGRLQSETDGRTRPQASVDLLVGRLNGGKR